MRKFDLQLLSIDNEWNLGLPARLNARHLSVMIYSFAWDETPCQMDLETLYGANMTDTQNVNKHIATHIFKYGPDICCDQQQFGVLSCHHSALC